MKYIAAAMNLEKLPGPCTLDIRPVLARDALRDIGGRAASLLSVGEVAHVRRQLARHRDALSGFDRRAAHSADSLLRSLADGERNLARYGATIYALSAEHGCEADQWWKVTVSRRNMRNLGVIARLKRRLGLC